MKLLYWVDTLHSLWQWFWNSICQGIDWLNFSRNSLPFQVFGHQIVQLLSLVEIAMPWSTLTSDNSASHVIELFCLGLWNGHGLVLLVWVWHLIPSIWEALIHKLTLVLLLWGKLSRCFECVVILLIYLSWRTCFFLSDAQDLTQRIVHSLSRRIEWFGGSQVFFIRGDQVVIFGSTCFVTRTRFSFNRRYGYSGTFLSWSETIDSEIIENLLASWPVTCSHSLALLIRSHILLPFALMIEGLIVTWW